MKYWQKKRNYRKHTREDGTVAYVITVDDQDVEVSAEVYAAYAQGDRKERYQAERDTGLVLSLDRLAEDEVHLSYLTDRHIESAEDTAVRSMMVEQMTSPLTDEEQALIHALFVENLSEREYAQRIGLSQKGVNKRKKKIIEKISAFWYSTPSVFRDGQ